jgi:hypothetical protein
MRHIGDDERWEYEDLRREAQWERQQRNRRCQDCGVRGGSHTSPNCPGYDDRDTPDDEGGAL